MHIPCKLRLRGGSASPLPRLFALLVLVTGALLPAYGQTPLGSLTCRGGSSFFSAPVYAFTTEARPAGGSAALALDIHALPSLSSPSLATTYDTCVVASGDSRIIFPIVMLDPAITTTVAGAGTVAANAQQYVELSFEYNNDLTVSLASGLPAPSAPLGTMNCSGSPNLSVPVYRVGFNGYNPYDSYDEEYPYSFDVDMGAAPYAALAYAVEYNFFGSPIGYGECDLTVGGATISWSNVALNVPEMEASGPNVLNAAGELFARVSFQASYQDLGGLSLSANIKPVTTLTCQNPALSLPVYNFSLGGGIDFDPNALQTVQNLSATTFGSCTLGSGRQSITLGGVSIFDAQLEGEIFPSGTEVFTSADLGSQSIAVGGAPAMKVTAGSSQAARKAAVPQEPGSQKASMADARARLEELLGGKPKLTLH